MNTTNIDTKFIHHSIGDNELKIDGKIAVPIEPAIITVGVQNPEKEEILQKEDWRTHRTRLGRISPCGIGTADQ